MQNIQPPHAGQQESSYIRNCPKRNLDSWKEPQSSREASLDSWRLGLLVFESHLVAGKLLEKVAHPPLGFAGWLIDTSLPIADRNDADPKPLCQVGLQLMQCQALLFYLACKGFGWTGEMLTGSPVRGIWNPPYPNVNGTDCQNATNMFQMRHFHGRTLAGNQGNFRKKAGFVAG
jgi:hypothetical protein